MRRQREDEIKRDVEDIADVLKKEIGNVDPLGEKNAGEIMAIAGYFRDDEIEAVMQHEEKVYGEGLPVESIRKALGGMFRVEVDAEACRRAGAKIAQLLGDAGCEDRTRNEAKGDEIAKSDCRTWDEAYMELRAIAFCQVPHHEVKAHTERHPDGRRVEIELKGMNGGVPKWRVSGPGKPESEAEIAEGGWKAIWKDLVSVCDEWVAGKSMEEHHERVRQGCGAPAGEK